METMRVKCKLRQQDLVSDAPVSNKKEPARNSHKSRPPMRISSEQPRKTSMPSSRPTSVIRTNPEVLVRYP